MITVTRTTTESSMTVTLAPGPVAHDYRARISTPIPFLSHMIEHIVWRSGFNLTVDVKLDRFDLSHVVCEDLGQTIGRAFLEYGAQTDGTVGFGDAVGIIDEARSFAAISMEGRSYFCCDAKIDALPPMTEGMATEDLSVFLDGFAQGARATVQLELQRGSNAHHVWESAYRAFGAALKCAFAADPARRGMTSGVAGAIEYSIEKGE